MTPQERKNRALAATMLEHYERGDHAGMLALLTDNCEFHIGAGKSRGVVPYHGSHRGHDQISAYLQKRRQHSMRTDCILEPPGGTTEATTETTTTATDDTPQPKRAPEFFVHGDTVVAIGHLVDKFADGSYMHDSDFALVFRIDEKAGKVRYFQYFFDTAGAADAWRHRKK